MEAGLDDNDRWAAGGARFWRGGAVADHPAARLWFERRGPDWPRPGLEIRPALDRLRGARCAAALPGRAGRLPVVADHKLRPGLPGGRCGVGGAGARRLHRRRAGAPWPDRGGAGACRLQPGDDDGAARRAAQGAAAGRHRWIFRHAGRRGGSGGSRDDPPADLVDPRRRRSDGPRRRPASGGSRPHPERLCGRDPRLTGPRPRHRPAPASPSVAGS